MISAEDLHEAVKASAYRIAQDIQSTIALAPHINPDSISRALMFNVQVFLKERHDNTVLDDASLTSIIPEPEPEVKLEDIQIPGADSVVHEDEDEPPSEES